MLSPNFEQLVARKLGLVVVIPKDGRPRDAAVFDGLHHIAVSLRRIVDILAAQNIPGEGNQVGTLDVEHLLDQSPRSQVGGLTVVPMDVGELDDGEGAVGPETKLGAVFARLMGHPQNLAEIGRKIRP